MDHCQQIRKVTLSGARETQSTKRHIYTCYTRFFEETAGIRFGVLYNARQSVRAVPGGGKQISINSSKGGQSYRDRHHPGKHSQQFLPKCLKKHKKWLSRWLTCWLNDLFINSSSIIDWFTERLNTLFNSLPAYHYKTMVIYACRCEIEFLNVFQAWTQDWEKIVSILGMSLKCNDLPMKKHQLSVAPSLQGASQQVAPHVWFGRLSCWMHFLMQSQRGLMSQAGIKPATCYLPN